MKTRHKPEFDSTSTSVKRTLYTNNHRLVLPRSRVVPAARRFPTILTASRYIYILHPPEVAKPAHQSRWTSAGHAHTPSLLRPVYDSLRHGCDPRLEWSYRSFEVRLLGFYSSHPHLGGFLPKLDFSGLLYFCLQLNFDVQGELYPI
jgi:hypothetical protein